MSTVQWFVLTVIILHISQALECVSKPKLSSSCSPGGSIILFDQNEPFRWALQPTNRSDESAYKPRLHFPVGGACADINVCHGNNVDLIRVHNVLSHLLWSNIYECFHHYCGLTGISYFCFSENKNATSANKYSSALLINTVQHIQDLNISCAIEMTGRKLETILNFKCMWNALYYGIQSVITISDVESTVNYTCPDLPEDGSHVMKISPWTLFERKFEANCSLNEPYQQSCNFSLYITPWVSNISLGESIVLTCPGNYSQLKWQEITSNGVSILNASEKPSPIMLTNLMKMLWSLCVVLSLGAENLCLELGKSLWEIPLHLWHQLSPLILVLNRILEQHPQRRK